MLRIIFSFLFTVVIFFYADAQSKNSLSGSVIDSSLKQPVEYATITLTDAKNNKVINGATTDSLGYFMVENVDSGVYNIKVESIGYAPKTIKNFVVKQSRVAQTTGTIRLLKSTTTLKDVTVTTQQKLVENKIDKMVYNAENDLTSQGGVATDILKKVPQVSVDADGNVELAGSSDIRFLINGKPSTAFGSNIADVLQAIPASEIKSIEVITNPGAKYDAEGLGGIINIILKKSRVNGVNGNLSLTGGSRISTGSLNLTVKKNNFSVNGYINGIRRYPAGTPTQVYRTTVDTVAKENGILQQTGNPQSSRIGYGGGVGFDWTIDKYNSVSGSFDYDVFGVKTRGITNQQQQTIPFDADSATTNIFSVNNFGNNIMSHSNNASLTYIKTFAREDQTLEIDFNTSIGKNRFQSDNFQTLLPQDSVYYGINNNNFGHEDETELEIDYTQPVNKKVTFDAGADFTFDNIKSNSDVYSLQTNSKLYLYDSSISNNLIYKQNIYAAYAELSFPVGKLFDAKLGTRYERTEISTYFSNAAEQAPTPGYNTLAPSASLLKKITETQTIKFSYSRRINRPDYDDLNPFINTTDPKNISAGNPYLKPEKGNRFELSYNHDYNQAGSFMITAFYRESNDDIQPYTQFYSSYIIADSVYYNVALSTRENIGREENIGLNLFGTVKASDKFNFRSNLSFFRRHIINAIDLGRSPVSFNYRLNLNVTYQFDKTLSAEFFGNFNSPRNEIQGRYPSFTNYTFAARKQFWNKKASLAFTANNFAGKYLKFKTVLYGTDFTTNNYRDVPFRSFGLNFTYKFGKLDFKKDKDKKDNAPDDSSNQNSGG